MFLKFVKIGEMKTNTYVQMAQRKLKKRRIYVKENLLRVFTESWHHRIARLERTSGDHPVNIPAKIGSLE